MIETCIYCQMNTVGEHEYNCPMHPRHSERKTPIHMGSPHIVKNKVTMDIPLTKEDMIDDLGSKLKAKDKTISDLEERIRGLEEVQKSLKLVAKGKVTMDLPQLDIWFIEGKQINSLFKKYHKKEIEIYVRQL